ncbi:MAG TPA: hypothetical protein VJI98_03415 [Candidatus Nanoarchaeia archaeon]|nr:hypothetical protein [Candidatus Nanoarchaeia archaeon]
MRQLAPSLEDWKSWRLFLDIEPKLASSKYYERSLDQAIIKSIEADV